MNGHFANDPKPEGVIILLGNESTEAGLSLVAQARCERVVELAQQFPSYSILPTGGFGRFNPTDRAHGELLRDQLIVLGIEPQRILVYTNSANTIEDALFSRRRIEDGGIHNIIVVTSEFHMERSQYIFRRIFPEYLIDFQAALNGVVDAAIQEKEAQKLRMIKAEWVDIPLYKKGDDFPSSIYNQTSAEQKHYDILSISVISGIFIVFGYPYAVSMQPCIIRSIGFVISALAITALWLIYHRMAAYARVARRILQRIEAQYGPGFSLASPRQDTAARPRIHLLTHRGASITDSVTIITITMVALQLFVFGLLWWRVFRF